MQVGLHHDRVEFLIHVAAAFEQCREAGPTALGSACLGAFERGGVDEHGGFGLDELLVQSFGRGTDPLGDIGEFELPQQIKQADWPSHRGCIL